MLCDSLSVVDTNAVLHCAAERKTMAERRLTVSQLCGYKSNEMEWNKYLCERRALCSWLVGHLLEHYTQLHSIEDKS